MIAILTERLRIREHCASDLASHHQLLSDPKVMHYLADIQTKTLAQSRENLQFAIAQAPKKPRTHYFWQIEKRIDQSPVGEIGYEVVKCQGAEKQVHLGYFLFSEFWGQGFVTEAVKGVLSFAFEQDGVTCMETGCLTENVASERVMLKCGFKKLRFLPNHEVLDGRLKDRVEYQLTLADYLKINK